MFNIAKNRILVASLAAAAALSVGGCGGDKPGERGSSPTAAPDVKDDESFQSSLPDLQPQALVGLDANQVSRRIFTDRYSRLIHVGDGRVRDYGGVEFSTELVDFTKLLVPSRAKEFEGHVGDFAVVAACTAREAKNAYSLHIGILPPELATDEMISKGKNGDYIPIMDRNTRCESWGPSLPLSRMN